MDGHKETTGHCGSHKMKSTLTLLTTSVLCSLAALHAAEPVTNSIGMKLVRIEPGTFTTG